MTEGIALVPRRSCDGCTMCCWLLRIEELAKPDHCLCPHAASGAGCSIYEDRPLACREFFCGYRALPFAGLHWFPPECGMMIFPMASEKRLAVHVDPDRPDAWREEPFHSDLRQWAIAAELMDMQLTVAIGRRIIAILPDGDFDLGEFAEGERLVYRRQRVGGRDTLRAFKEPPAR